MEHRGVRPAADDRVVRHRISARAERRRLELDLHVSLAGPVAQERNRRRKRSARRQGRDPHALELQRVLGPANAVQPGAQVLDQRGAGPGVGRRGAQPRRGASRARGEPFGQRGGRQPLLRLRRRPRPQTVVLRDRGDEVKPSLTGIEREDAARQVAIGEIEVLRVRVERVRGVAATGHGDRLARADQHDLVGQAPLARDRAAASLELLLHLRMLGSCSQAAQSKSVSRRAATTGMPGSREGGRGSPPCAGVCRPCR